jgi:hypothetical protein
MYEELEQPDISGLVKRAIQKGPQAGGVHSEENDPDKKSQQQVFKSAQRPVGHRGKWKFRPKIRQPASASFSG